MNLLQILQDPDWLLFRIRMNTDQVEFAKYPKMERVRVNCLSAENYQSSEPNQVFSVADFAKAVAALPARHQPIHFIFHSAFCGSTLLSRCFDLTGTAHALREPLILQSLANAQRLQWRSTSTGLDWKGLLPLVMRALQVQCASEESLLIKPLNTVNSLIPALLSVTRNAKAILLVSDLDRFVISTLSKGEETRVLVRNMFNQVRLDVPQLQQMSAGAALPLSDLMIMVSLWRMQVQQMQDIAAHPNLGTQIRSLHTDQFLQNPRLVLEHAMDFFDLDIGATEITKIVKGPVFQSDAKLADQKFDPNAEQARKEKIATFFKKDIEKTYAWMRASNPNVQVYPEMANPLCT